MLFDAYHYTVTERFLRYVRIDTQSDPLSRTVPSTLKQKDLGRLLVKELQEMGVRDAQLDDYGYVYATVPSNTEKKEVPVICFCSHKKAFKTFNKDARYKKSTAWKILKCKTLNIKCKTIVKLFYN